MQKIIAITGPSGIGKTTLGNMLINNNEFVTPRHTTTRKKRLDDETDFYRYITHAQFKTYVELGNFLFWSGDNKIVDSANGNFYGILNRDFQAISSRNNILIYVSYKDIERLIKLKSDGLNFEIINLVYSNIEKNLPNRLKNSFRNCSEEEIQNRLQNAINYENIFRKYLDSHYTILKIYNDILNPEETYQEVVRKLVRGK